jgi:hypothetical protein
VAQNLEYPLNERAMLWVLRQNLMKTVGHASSGIPKTKYPPKYIPIVRFNILFWRLFNLRSGIYVGTPNFTVMYFVGHLPAILSAAI